MPFSDDVAHVAARGLTRDERDCTVDGDASYDYVRLGPLGEQLLGSVAHDRNSARTGCRCQRTRRNSPRARAADLRGAAQPLCGLRRASSVGEDATGRAGRRTYMVAAMTPASPTIRSSKPTTQSPAAKHTTPLTTAAGTRTTSTIARRPYRLHHHPDLNERRGRARHGRSVEATCRGTEEVCQASPLSCRERHAERQIGVGSGGHTSS